MTSAPTLTPGQLVAGRYRLDAIVGEGGFGTVYRATELRLDRAVALKALRREALVQQDVESRFAREAQLAKSLEHPNTVRLLDFGTAEDGTPFIVYELLRGLALDELLHAVGSLPHDRVARVAMQVLKSLMEAHAQGIVHRDIKPSNIYLCEFSGERDFVKVLDFGIAKADQHQQRALTAVGVAMGTPAYMAPEQVRGTGVGPATDLYALGLVMAEALSGHPVMQGTTPAMIALEHISERPVPLPDVVRQTPLEPIITRATAKDPALRYSSASEMLSDLERRAALGQTMPSVAPAASGGLPTNSIRVERPHHSPTAYGHTADVAVPPQPWTAPTPGPFGSASTPPPIFGPSPLAMGPAPAAARSSSNTGLILAVGGFGAFLVIITIGALVVFLRARAPAPSSSGPDRGSKPVAEGESRGSGRIRDLSGAQVEKRLAALGWNVTGKSNSTSDAFRMDVFQLGRTGAAGTVQLYAYRDESTAKLVVEQMAKNITPGMVFERDGGSVLIVYIVEISGGPQRGETSQRLMAELTKP